jgi:hypothetical protein
MTERARSGKPVMPFTTLRTAPDFFLLFHVLYYAVLLHIIPVCNNIGMMRNAVNNVNIGEVLEALAGEVRALEAPGHLLFSGTAAETMPAINTMRHYPGRETAIATDLGDGDIPFPGNFL